MNKSHVAKVFNSAKRVTVKHSPEILLGLGIAGMVTTTVLSVRATPKAMALIEEEKKVLHRRSLSLGRTQLEDLQLSL